VAESGVAWAVRRGRPCRGRRPRRGVEGSASAELVILTPVMVALVGLVFAAGQVLRADEAVADAARTAVESAVVTTDPGAADRAAVLEAASVLRGDGVACFPVLVTVDTSRFEPGGAVQVTVSCRAAVGRLTLVPFPGAFTLTARASAVIEPFREVAG